MATHKNIDELIRSLENRIRAKVPYIVAETATEHFKQRFQTKEWDGQPWQKNKGIVKRGSLMVRSSALVNSIRPSLISMNRVRISAGNAKVPYAKVHNEGGTLKPKVTAKMKKFAWAQYYQTKNPAFKGIALTKKSHLTINIPKRQFMGKSPILNNKIHQRIITILTNN